MQGCSLSCKGTGLNHLFSPIVTRASRSRPAHWLPSAEAPGVLKVVETKLRVWPLLPGMRKNAAESLETPWMLVQSLIRYSMCA